MSDQLTSESVKHYSAAIKQSINIFTKINEKWLPDFKQINMLVDFKISNINIEII